MWIQRLGLGNIGVVRFRFRFGGIVPIYARRLVWACGCLELLRRRLVPPLLSQHQDARNQDGNQQKADRAAHSRAHDGV